jgi:hypothetical protein
MALGILLSRRAWLSSTAHLTWLSQKTVGDGENLLTYLNSALKVHLGTDIFLSVPKKSKNLFSGEICKYTYFSTFNLAVTKKRVLEKNCLHICIQR